MRERLGEGIANGQHPLADLEIARAAEGDRVEPARLDPDHRDVALRIGSLDLGGHHLSVGKDHLDLRAVLDDVVVGQDVAMIVDDHTGAETSLDVLFAARLAPAAVRPGPKEILERVGEEEWRS